MKVGREIEFERFFSQLGTWKLVLGRAEGYLGTRCECISPPEGRFQVFDFWKSHLDFEHFRLRFVRELESFQQMMLECEWLEKEIWLGAFYEDDPGPGEGSGLVPA